MASLLRRARPLQASRRTFSTTTPRLVNLQWEKNHPEALAEHIPPYPYGPTRLYKQSAKGLYGGQRLQFGNNVSDRYEVKTRRQWHPNIKVKRLFSKSLNRYVQVRVSTRVLRTIDKLGGLDEYLLGEKEGRIRELGESGWWLRWAIMQTHGVQKRFAAEREALGLPADADELRVEEEDAEATLAASTPDAEVAELASAEDADLEADPEAEAGVSELLAEDDAFQVEDNVKLPPLKFRVGPGQHIMLTERGWRRTRPYDTREQSKKDRIRKNEESFFMKVRMAELEKQLDGVRLAPQSVESSSTPELAETLEDATVGQAPLAVDPAATEAESQAARPLNEQERSELIKAAKKQFREELDARVDAIYAQKIAARDARRAQLKAEKKEKKARQSAQPVANVA